ncbi:MAG: hypothetical protein ACE5Q6_22665, partial [Dehalococcoidia bacterium]
MPWHTPITWTAGQIVDKTDLDEQVRDNLNETAPAKVTTKGDIVAGTGANAIGRVAVGANSTGLVADSAQAAGVKFDDLTNHIDGDHLDIDWNPTNYTPDATPSEAADVDDLTAHLKGIDDQLGVISTSYNSYTSNDTWTKPAGAGTIVIEAYGGGGGGGGGAGNAATNEGGGGGGGGANVIRVVSDAGDVPASLTITIGGGGGGGSGGSSATGGSGSGGGTTTVSGTGFDINAYGGSG